MAEAVLCAVCRVGAGLRPRPVFRGRGVCRGRPMCRPGNGPSRAPPTGGHIGPPLREAGSVPEPTGIGAKTDLANGAGRSPPPTGGGAGRRVQDGGVRATEATLAVHSSGPMYLRHGFRRPNFVPKFGASVMGIGPYGETGKLHRPPGPAAHSEAYALRSRGMGGNRSRDHPQSTQQRRAIPQSRRSRDSSLCTREPLGTGDADCRVASLLAMTVLILCHSEEAQRADAPGA